MSNEQLDADGYRTLKTWGAWELKRHHKAADGLDGLYLENSARSYYAINLDDVFGPTGLGADHWILHIGAKTWPEHEKHDLVRALNDLEQPRV